MHPLNHRFRLANHLATAVLYVHSGHFVHKTVKPENILMMTSSTPQQPSDQFPYTLGWPFLVGFDRCRPASAFSGKVGDGKLEDCIYQHPTRWGVVAEEAFAMTHDIYSLGVVLLEIGLWRPLVLWDETTNAYSFAPFLQEFVNGTILGGCAMGALVKERLVSQAKQWLPPCMGEAYTKVVVACLEVYEGGMVMLSDFDRPDDEALTVAYINYVVSKLEDLKV
jgi:hypothetical protein